MRPTDSSVLAEEVQGTLLTVGNGQRMLHFHTADGTYIESAPKGDAALVRWAVEIERALGVKIRWAKPQIQILEVSYTERNWRSFQRSVDAMRRAGA